MIPPTRHRSISALVALPVALHRFYDPQRSEERERRNRWLVGGILRARRTQKHQMNVPTNGKNYFGSAITALAFAVFALLFCVKRIRVL